MQTKVKFTNKQPQNFSEKTTKRPFLATSTKLVYTPKSFNEEKFKLTSSHLPLLTTYYQTQHFIQNNSINPDYYNVANFSQKQHPHQMFFSQMNVSLVLIFSVLILNRFENTLDNFLNERSYESK